MVRNVEHLAAELQFDPLTQSASHSLRIDYRSILCKTAADNAKRFLQSRGVRGRLTDRITGIQERYWPLCRPFQIARIAFDVPAFIAGIVAFSGQRQIECIVEQQYRRSSLPLEDARHLPPFQELCPGFARRQIISRGGREAVPDVIVSIPFFRLIIQTILAG